MHRNGRRLVAAIFVLVASLVLFSPNGPAISDPSPPALTGLRTCLAETHRLDVLFLIDESGSLGGKNGTDPTGQRVTGIRAAIAGLERLSGSRTPITVNALLMGFSSVVETAPTFDPKKLGSFQRVTSKSAPRLLRQAGSFAKRDDGKATDFTIALAAARKKLARQAAAASAAGRATCQTVVLFTDGRYDPLGSRSAGLARLCKAGGVNDALRADGVTVLTVALSTQLNSSDLGFLQGLTDGTGGGSCGRLASADNGYLLSDDRAGSLALLFGNLFSEGSEPAEVPGKFRVVTGVDGFLVRVSAGSGGAGTVTLTAPGGETFDVALGARGSGKLGGFTLEATSYSKSYLELAGTASGPVAPGVWRLDSDAPDALFSVSLSSSVTPTVVGDLPDVRPGSVATLPVDMRLANGELLASGDLASGAILAATVSENGTSSPRQVAVRGGAGRYVAEVGSASSSSAASYVVTLRAELPDIDEIPVSGGEAVVRLGRGLAAGPSLARDTLEFGRLLDTDSVTGVLQLEGDPRVGGCVWVTDPEFTVANGAAQILVDRAEPSSRRACLKIAAGGSGQIDVMVHASKKAYGALGGQIDLHILPDGSTDEQVVSVPATGRLDVKTHIGPALWIVVVLMTLGTVAPLLLLHLLNRRVAGFTPEARLYRWVDDVVVHNGLVAATEAPLEPVAPGLAAFAYANDGSVGVSRLTRRMHHAGIEFEAVASGSREDRTFGLFRGPYGTATCEGLVGGSASGRFGTAGSGTRLAVPLAIGGSWFFVPVGRDAEGRQAGKLLLLLADTASEEDLNSLLGAVALTLPTIEFPGSGEPGTTDLGLGLNISSSDEITLDDPL